MYFKKEIFVFFMLINFAGLLPRCISVKSKEKFYNAVNSNYDHIMNQYKYAIVYFNQERDKTFKKNNRILYKRLKKLEKIFDNLSRAYKKEIRFIKVFLPLCELKILFEELQIKKYSLKNYYPIFILFKNGEVLKDHGKAVMLTGFTSYNKLNELINDYFSIGVDQMKEQREQYELRRAEINALYWNSFGWGCYGPCWGPGYRWGHWCW